jgi:hypothetical protein
MMMNPEETGENTGKKKKKKKGNHFRLKKLSIVTPHSLTRVVAAIS